MLMHNVYLTIVIAIFLGVLDHFLTIKGYRLYKQGYIQYVELRYYELNPLWRENIEKSEYDYKHFLLWILIGILIYVIYILDINAFYFIQGAILSLYIVVNARHIKNLVVFSAVKKNPALLSGKLKTTYLFSLKNASAEMFGILIVLLFLFVFSPSFFTFGVVVGPLFILLNIMIWTRKHSHSK